MTKRTVTIQLPTDGNSSLDASARRMTATSTSRSIDCDACHLRCLLALLVANGQIEREGTSRCRRPLDPVPLLARMTRNPGGSAPPVIDHSYGVRPPDAKRFWK